MSFALFKHSAFFALVLMLAGLILTRCSPVMTVQGSTQRETSPQVSEAVRSNLVDGTNTFAFDLYRATREQASNLFFSPYSISLALSMTYAGARRDTAQQMAKTLHFNVPSPELHSAFNALDLQLASENQAPFKLNLDNSIWGQAEFPFQRDFVDTLARNYGASLRAVDFASDGRREDTRLTINRWVSDQTEGKIKDLIGKDVLNALTRLILVNAIYFKGEWENAFMAADNADFDLLQGGAVGVPFMTRRTDYGYAEEPGYQALEIPYKGDRMRMIVLLPAAGQFESFESSLDNAQFQAIVGKLQIQDLKVYMPKFRYESRLGLRQTLAAMGMPDAFDRDRADFDGIYDRGKVSQNLFISDVVHDSWIAVDERGTEAAAATGVIMEIVSMPKEVRIDRPFIFIIQDKQTHSILFIGRVLDPTR